MLRLVQRAARSGVRVRSVLVRLQSSDVRPSLLDALEERNMVQATTSSSLKPHMATVEKGALVPRTVYAGVDPSAPSMHVGNLLPLFALLHCALHGHTALVLVGGGTGAIGDPSGRSTERSALDAEQLKANVASIRAQMYQFFHNAAAYLERRGMINAPVNTYTTEGSANPAGESLFGSGLDVRIVNNFSWLQPVSLIQFLSEVGRHARVNDMLARDSVKNRLTTPGAEANSAPGLSFTEFSYQLLQAYDFSVLHRAPWHCSLQIGGSDQMGNISAGIDLIRRQQAADGADIREDPAYGLTLPLLTTSSGAKFGKSAGNAVWISPSLLSDLDFYQYFLRSADADVERYLRSLTLLSSDEIASVLEEHSKDRTKRLAQEKLAAEMTELVRGEAALRRARVATKVLFGTSLDQLRTDEVLFAFEDDPRLVHMPQGALESEVLRLAVDSGLTASRRLYLNGAAVTDAKATLSTSNLLDGRFVVMRAGKHNRKILVLA
ncbi:tyrosine--tRNA ligase [Malassezia japonica]|uniref:tyrosine--tRNA ligase n=1 Tax=Malassezia japonica TaxID=223818 RepID=A0AAF0JG20_9BASI|nr:tyrosine--tRNA ligase [Malassezia japonica]WFD39496.1 tyrosine--tRNA ligase [Malassezia japonica]